MDEQQKAHSDNGIIKRLRQFYQDNKDAQNFVGDMLETENDPNLVLYKMREVFAVEYYEWKKKNGIHLGASDFKCISALGKELIVADKPKPTSCGICITEANAGLKLD